MFDYSRLTLCYEPFPYGSAPGILDASHHERLARQFPTQDAFESSGPDKGSRSHLSRATDPSGFKRFLRSSPVWREFYHRTNQREFVERLLDMLADRGVDLRRGPSPSRRSRTLLALAHALKHRRAFISTELVFVRMPARGGFLRPHTDSPGKLLNLVVAMNSPGEWDPSFGGGTNINVPTDRRRLFNYRNARVPFDGMDVIDTVPFESNQGVVVVKTFNSWHSIAPMAGPAGVARKTINLNLMTMT